MNRIILLLLILLLPFGLISQNAKKVLVIGIDGCRSDVLQVTNTPNIDNLISNGLFSPDALNDDITISGPGWSAILCGVWSDKHGVVNNNFNGSDYENYPPFFKYINDFNPDLNTISICNWSPINEFIIQDHADEIINLGTDLEVATQAKNYLTDENPDVVFLHFDNVDHAGHAFGFSSDSPEYVSSIEGVDTYVGSVMQAIVERPNYNSEDWMIIVTTDHGGNGFSHGGTTIEEENVFMIVSGNNIETDIILKDSSIVIDDPFNCLGDSIELKFSGDNNFVQVLPNSIFNFDADQDFTIECRVRTSVAADVSIVGNKDWDSGINKGFVFSFKYPSGPEWKVNIGDGENRADINTGGEIADGEWHTLSVSFDRDGFMKMYQDGLLIDSTDISSIGDITTDEGLFFGADINSAFDFSGAIAEVRVWDALISNPIIESWNCISLDNSHPNYSDLIGYWMMNEGEGSLAVIDNSSNENNGTINGAEWVNPEAILVFDYTSTPRLTDVLPTVLDHLCIPISTDWGLDGQSLISNCITTDIEEQEFLLTENKFQIFPNPTSNEVYVRLNNQTINYPIQFQIYSSIGIKVYDKKIFNDGITIDVSGFNEGVYFFTVETEDGQLATKKIIVSSPN
jgi:Uncharacterized proteins of the AP superfamily